MHATKFVEEELRPNLPATIPANATWTLQAQQLMTDSPEAYAGIVACLCDGESNAKLAKRLNLPVALVRKIRELHPVAIEAGKKAVLGKLEEALHNTIDRLVDNVDKIPIPQLAMNFGILYDKTQLATGGATSRIEHVKAPSKEELDAMFNALPEAKAIPIEDKKE